MAVGGVPQFGLLESAITPRMDRLEGLGLAGHLSLSLSLTASACGEQEPPRSPPFSRRLDVLHTADFRVSKRKEGLGLSQPSEALLPQSNAESHFKVH